MISTLNALVVLSLTLPSFATAANQVGVLAQTEGRAQLFTNPSKKPYPEKSLKDGTMALFEGEYYLIHDAKVGDKVENGNIVRTLPGGQTKILYDNGDQFYVGPGTAYRVSWNGNAKSEDAAAAKINLMYGRFRGVVAKEGPRKKLEIRTRAATMGVRGTDFFIADNGPNGETEISVIRGSVEVKSNEGKPTEVKTSEVKTGMSASVTEKIEVRETTKEDLSGIQKASSLPAPQQKAPPAIAVLEKKAIEVTSKDIALYQPELYKQISPTLNEVKNSQELNSKMVTLVAATAPSAPPKRRKPRITEMKDADDGDYYDKYFKVGN